MAIDRAELEAVKKAIRKQEKGIMGALAAALHAEGLAIDAKAVNLCPVDTGRLRSSHFVAPAENPKDPFVIVGFGTNYAVYVHERTDQRHSPPTQANFLRQPMEEAQAGYADRIAVRTLKYRDAGVSMAINTATPTKPSDRDTGEG